MLISLLLNFQRLVKDAVDAGDNTEEESNKKKKRSKVQRIRRHKGFSENLVHVNVIQE